MRILSLIAVLAAAAFGFLKLSQFSGDNALAIFNVAGYELQIPFVGFVLIALIIFVVLYFLCRIIGGLFRSPKHVGEWNQVRNEKLSQAKLGEGFLALMKGDWKRAEKQLMSKTEFSEVPFVNFLAAAQAAQEQGKYDKRDEYLAKALDKTPKNRLAINMTRARLSQQIGRSDDALKSLMEVEDLGRKNAQYIAMLAQAYDETNDNEKLEKLLPQVRRMEALPSSVIAQMQAELDIEYFNDAEDKDAAWKSIAKTSQKDPDFISIYAEYHINKGRPDLAEKLIRTTLKNEWDESLVNIYGRIESTNRKKLLRQVDGWILARPESAELRLAAGRLAMQSKDVERAQKEFEHAIKLGGLLEAFEELGLLHESEQDLRKALALYRSGLGTANAVNTYALADEINTEKDEEQQNQPQDDVAQEGELMPQSNTYKSNA